MSGEGSYSALMPFTDKRLTVLEPSSIGGYQLKRYHIDQIEQPLTAAVVDAAYAAVETVIPPVDVGTPPCGWVVVHRGAGTGAYALVYTWTWDNVVEVHSAAAGQPVIGCTDDDPTNFVALHKTWIGCVWELAVLEHERAAWVRHVLDEDPPDIEGYLKDSYNAATVGR